VTITRPVSSKPYALAILGLTGGLVVGAIGLLRGRKLVEAGSEQLRLQERLDQLEAKVKARRKSPSQSLAEKRLALRRLLA
jgi:hypothetical protein